MLLAGLKISIRQCKSALSIHGPAKAFSTLMIFGSKEIFCLHQTVRTSRGNATRSLAVFPNLPDLLDEPGRSLLFAFDASLNLVLHNEAALGRNCFLPSFFEMH